MNHNSSIILLLLSAVYTFTSPQYKEATDLNNLAGQYRHALNNASETIALRDQLLVTYSSIPAADLDRINKILPDNVDTVRLALDLDNMAARYGIAIKSVQTTVSEGNEIVLPNQSNTYEKATVTFSFISNYQDFLSFMADLEKNLRIMDIQTLTFTVGETNLYEYKVSVDTYWIK